ncbi:hypothetical protein WISP_128863 [Willisornis vidua]|uniref:Uncharacterized protein n=1 Tax=Willisornis vidua TaxID=1566151 RepID=A0ABQ9CQI0_9PASS|nr:hypothetical protein WISP_128863 [Willisornis vidua]
MKDYQFCCHLLAAAISPGKKNFKEENNIGEYSTKGIKYQKSNAMGLIPKDILVETYNLYNEPQKKDSAFKKYGNAKDEIITIATSYSIPVICNVGRPNTQKKKRNEKKKKEDKKKVKEPGV